MKLISYRNMRIGEKVKYSISTAIQLITILTAFLYLSFYKSDENYALTAFLVPLITAVLSLVLSLFKGSNKLCPYLLFFGNLIGLSQFIYSTYYYISVVIVGIDASSFSAQFLSILILYTICFIASVVLIFLKTNDEEEKI